MKLRWVPLPFAFIAGTLNLHAQADCRTRQQLIDANVPMPQYDHGRTNDTTLTNLMLSTYIGDRTSGYLTIPGIGFAEDQERQHTNAPLTDGEGKEGYFFEANVDLLYTISSGRNDPHFFLAGNRVGLYFNNTIRMTNDPSHPLLPGNWKIGLAGEFPILLSHFSKERKAAQRSVDDRRSARDDLSKLAKTDSTAKPAEVKADHAVLETLRERNARVVAQNLSRSRFLYGTWQFLHYSNGQDTGFYADKESLRNDYRTGDFSTNYFLLKVNYAYRYNGNMVTMGSGIRRDIGPNDNGIAFSPEQEHGYGRTRFVGHVQWRSKPFWLKAWCLPLFVHRRFEDNDRPSCHRTYRLREYAEFRARAEVDGILESKEQLPQFPYDKKYRWGTHLWLELNTMRSYSTGFFVHAYYGRDYLNIRYDRVVWLLMGGLSFTIEKYIPFGWRPAETIVLEH